MCRCTQTVYFIHILVDEYICGRKLQEYKGCVENNSFGLNVPSRGICVQCNNLIVRASLLGVDTLVFSKCEVM